MGSGVFVKTRGQFKVRIEYISGTIFMNCPVISPCCSLVLFETACIIDIGLEQQNQEFSDRRKALSHYDESRRSRRDAPAADQQL